MTRLTYQTNYISSYDLITKFNYKNIFLLPLINKIIINIGTTEKNNIIFIILLLELISTQKSQITKSKKNKINLKIKKGVITGCKIILRKKPMYLFIEKLIIFYFPKLKNFKGISVNNSKISFNLKNIFNIFELTNEFLKFKNINNINIIIFTKIKNFKQLGILLNSYNFPILKNFINS